MGNHIGTEVLNENPKATRKELRRHCEANYAWLLKNDYKWLKGYLPSNKGDRL
jgi:hypothetical protein